MKADAVSPKVQLVLDKITALGGQVVRIKENNGNCPFSGQVGADHQFKAVYFDFCKGSDTISALIHEAGHVLACEVPPKECSEYTFLGWEFAFAMELDVLPEFLEGHKDYMIDVSHAIYNLDADELSELIEERLDFAQRTGLLDEQGRAKAIR